MANEETTANKAKIPSQKEFSGADALKGQVVIDDQSMQETLQGCQDRMATPQNDHYKILSPSFLKITGLCISLFLCGACWILFFQNPRYNAVGFLLYEIFVGIIGVTLFFVFFVFSSIENSKLYLLNAYFLFFIHCVLFIFIASTSPTRVSDVKMMQKIILCLGFLFMFCEFLHAQTAENFAHERFVEACVMGVVSSLAALPWTGFMFFLSLMPAMAPFTMIYFIYALYTFILSLRKKEMCDMPFWGKFILICISFVLLIIGSFLQISENTMRINPKCVGVAFMGAWIVFGCNIFLLVYSGQTHEWNAAEKRRDMPFGSNFILFLIFFALLFGGGRSMLTDFFILTLNSSLYAKFTGKGVVFTVVWIVFRGILICIEQSREWNVKARGVFALALRCLYFTVLSCAGAVAWGGDY